MAVANIGSEYSQFIKNIETLAEFDEIYQKASLLFLYNVKSVSVDILVCIVILTHNFVFLLFCLKISFIYRLA